jgi:hypothetical protein
MTLSIVLYVFFFPRFVVAPSSIAIVTLAMRTTTVTTSIIIIFIQCFSAFIVPDVY